MLSKREAEDGTNPALAASMTPEQVSAWPGKVIDGRTHPALWHMLDVGAVATCLMAQRSLTEYREFFGASSRPIALIV